MTALLKYLDLLPNAREAKLLHAKRFLTYHTCLIVLCIYPEKYMPLRVRNHGYPDLCALLRPGYMTCLELSLLLESLFVRNRH